MKHQPLKSFGGRKGESLIAWRILDNPNPNPTAGHVIQVDAKIKLRNIKCSHGKLTGSHLPKENISEKNELNAILTL